MGKVIDTTSGATTAPAPRTAADRGAVVVYLGDHDRDLLAAHADDLTMPLAGLLRRLAVTAVHASRRPGVTPGQLVDGAGAALGRDFPATFGGDEHAHRRGRVAESVIRWLLTRCSVLPLPAPTDHLVDPDGCVDCDADDTGPEGVAVWRVRLDDGSDLDIRTHDGKVCVGGGLAFSPREWMAVAAAGAAAASTITTRGAVVETSGDLQRSTT